MYSLTFCVHFCARTPPVEARIPDCRSNVENAPVGGRSPAGRATFPYAARGIGGAPHRPQTPPSRPLPLCRHIAGWTQACK